jgi:two-component system, chemotaxis family, CheB/CheR fusion protein
LTSQDSSPSPSPDQSSSEDLLYLSRANDVEPSRPTHIVGVGASAGGLEALERLFQNLPDDTGMAFVVVQHLSPDFKSLMNEVLARWTSMPICSVNDQMPVTANTIYLMPPRTEMIISDRKLLLTARERSDELRLPIDQFLRSLARDVGAQSMAIILSGTGSDGSRGIRDINEAGGVVLAQDPETAKFDGMPRSAVETDVVDEILAPEEMPAAMLRRIHHPKAEQLGEVETDVLAPVFLMLRKAYKIDFSYYKPSTVARRMEHRMQLKRAPDLEEYVSMVRNNPEELDALYRDLLIGVTSFFRDPDSFHVLETEVLPALLGKLNTDDELRCWVAGCATGEEAYSLAILLHEGIRKSGKNLRAKVFATDVHARSLEVAAAGNYSNEALNSVSEKRLQEYFLATKDGYRVSPELRNMVVFAQHNVIKDAPFTRMDLITCRNLLIYLLPPAQNKALSLFHFGLKTGGVLFLGPSESPGELTGEFEVIHQHWKVYRKRRDAKLPPDLRLPLSPGLSGQLYPSNPATRDSGLSEVFAQVLEQSLPPSILVNSDLEILHTFGDAPRFLKLRRGQPSLGLMDMLEDDLRMAVGAALHRSAREKKPVTLNNVQVSRDDSSQLVHVSVTPLSATRRAGAHSLISFEEAVIPKAVERVETDLNLNEAARDHIHSLEADLRFTKENLQATIEELETSNEELQATNEELLASNEELQSTNEELHSVNEELYTVNREYQKKIEELTELTNDMDNLLSSTDVHTMFLDEQLCIRRFTPRMGVVFNLIESDVGRNIHGFMHSIRCTDFAEKLQGVLRERQQHEEEVENGEGESYLMRILPYKGDPRQAGVVVTLIDITNLKEAETRFRNAMDVSPNGMLMVSARGKITQLNAELERIFGYAPGELIGQSFEVLVPTDNAQQHEGLRQEYFRNPYVLRRMGGRPYVWGQHKSGRRIPLDINVRPISTPHGRQAIVSVVDVSQHQQLEESLREQVRQRDHFLATLSHELRNPMGAILTAASVLDVAGKMSAEITRPCNVIHRQASQIALLLDDLLDVARVTQGKITLRREVVDLVKVCHESIEAVQPMLSSHQHTLRTSFPDEPLWVDADRVRLLQIIENLLTNAIKYTDDRGQIELSLGEEDSQAVIRVTDNGRGMSPEFIASIFDMFVQFDSSLDRRESGLGVGLTLVRSLVEMHKGSIEAQSAGLGLGSEFTVRLPSELDPPTEVDRPQSPPAANRSHRIVLVEDDDDAREMTAALLKLHNHHVVATAGNGLEGLEVIRQHRPDIALLDIGLPLLDGYQLARRVREEFGGTVYLVALTGYGRPEDHQLVVESGFHQHLIKPVRIEQLNAILKRFSSS